MKRAEVAPPPPAVDAVNMLTGRGGWPMTVWLTPDRRPFMGGTYFPPRDGDRGSRKGFLTIIQELNQEYHVDPKGVSERAQRIALRLANYAVPRPGKGARKVECAGPGVVSVCCHLGPRFAMLHVAPKVLRSGPAAMPIVRTRCA